MKLIQIFKPGKHTPMKGEPIEFTEQHLRDAARYYDPAVHEAPFVIGHPKTDDPAYGWAKALQFADGFAAVEPRQVHAAFAEVVNDGRYKKISAAWYTPGSPNHPLEGKPGHDAYYLKHVGFLGAAAPAVKGLAPVSFAADEEGVVEFADWADRTSAGIFRRIRDWIIETAGLEKADAVLPEWEINSLQEAAMAPDPKPVSPAFAEPSPTKTKEQSVDKTPEQLAAEAAELKRRETALAAQEAAFAEREKANRRTEIAAFAEGLVKDGKLLPKDKDGVVAFMAALPADGVVEFGEGAGKQSTPSSDWLRAFLSGLPKQVEFSEVAGGKRVETTDNTDANAIAQAAVEFQEAEAKAGRVISVTAAVQHVTKGASK